MGAHFMSSVHDALGMIQREIGAVGKDSKSGDGKFGYNYRGVDAVTNAAHPLLGRHGVVLYPRVIEQETRAHMGFSKPHYLTILTIEYEVVGPDGDHLDPPIRVVGHGIDAGANSPGSAMSYAYRYALLQLLSLPTNNPNEDNETDPAPDDQAMVDAKFADDVVTRFGQLEPGKQTALLDWLSSFDPANPPAVTRKDLSERVPSDLVHRLSSQINKALQAAGGEAF